MKMYDLTYEDYMFLVPIFLILFMLFICFCIFIVKSCARFSTKSSTAKLKKHQHKKIDSKISTHKQRKLGHHDDESRYHEELRILDVRLNFAKQRAIRNSHDLSRERQHQKKSISKTDIKRISKSSLIYDLDQISTRNCRSSLLSKKKIVTISGRTTSRTSQSGSILSNSSKIDKNSRARDGSSGGNFGNKYRASNNNLIRVSKILSQREKLMNKAANKFKNKIQLHYNHAQQNNNICDILNS
jgi:hypothetical protein